MIIEHTPQVVGYAHRWQMGDATLLLPLGHAEYGLPDNEKVQVGSWAGDGNEGEEKPPPQPPWVLAHQEALRSAGGNYADPLGDEEFGDGWGTLVLLRGPVYELWKMFYQFANALDPEQDPADYTPGGDDDTFDYYPSAFECLSEWAKDLDKLDERYDAHVQEASKYWNEHMRIYARAAARHVFTARHRVVGIVSNLRVAKGPFEEWEFEDYAKPYLYSMEAR